MKTIRNILAGLMVAGFSIGGMGAAHSQESNPIVPVRTASTSTKKLTPEQLVEMFENMGYPAKCMNEGGQKFILVDIPHGDRVFKASVSWNDDQSVFIVRAFVEFKSGKETFEPEVLDAMLAQNSLNNVGTLYLHRFSDGSGIALFVRIENNGITPIQLRKTVNGFASDLQRVVEAYLVAKKAAAIAKAKEKDQGNVDPTQPLVP